MIENDFQTYMAGYGLIMQEPVIADGILRRFHVSGDKRQSKNGWYILFGDGVPAGSFGSWKTGDCCTWSAKPAEEMSQRERDDQARRMESARQARIAEEKRRQAEARQRAAEIWQSSKPAPDNHPYLERKAVQSHGLRICNNRLVIPLRDAEGDLHSLQFIDEGGNKRFLSGGRKKGCYFAIGTPQDSLCLAEGYATAGSVYQATGRSVAVAFDAGNLEPVAIAIRAKFPQMNIIICADSDPVGLEKAQQAASAIGARVAIV